MKKVEYIRFWNMHTECRHGKHHGQGGIHLYIEYEI